MCVPSTVASWLCKNLMQYVAMAMQVQNDILDVAVQQQEHRDGERAVPGADSVC